MDDLVNQLSRTLAQANRFIAAELKARGLDGIAPSHGDILMQLFARGDLPMGELACAIGRDPSTVTALVKKLAAAGYVRAGKSTEDRRATIVSLTGQGRALRGDFEAVSAALRETQGRGIAAEDAAAARRVLSAMRDNFESAMREDGEHGRKA